ncbi:hypothetical protein DKK76_07835 [Frischella perrara]|uniref:Cadherin domain-containing protein n=1 Tax=Frischella perrara TaxID=1267021 RepID=A0A318MWL9_FRIPE|nr:DUF2971 domain-containing protein [Frischella perrara]PXY94897.1 hypothetical protein DKK76_07835 [Frischella perrara]
MTELTIDQEIEQLKKITRQDGADKYAQALYDLAEIYHLDKDDIEQAEYYYRLVEKNDDRQTYAKAQCQLGYIYQFDKKDIVQAEYYYRLVEKNDSRQAYAKAQFQLGQIYQFDKDNIEHAEHYYRLVEKNDDRQTYAKAQCQLGYIYQFDKKDIVQAEYYYRLVEKNDSRQAYAKAQCQLGTIYQFYKDDIEQAEYYYLLVEKNDNRQAYAKAQCQLGTIYQFNKKDIVQAEYYYQLVEKNDNPPAYAYAQFQLGKIYQFYKNEIEQAEYYYQLVKENVNKKIFALAQFQLGVIYQFNKNDIKQAECHYQLVEKNDELSAYTRAQFNLGIIHSDDPQLASKYFLQVCDSEEAWLASNANLELGNIAYFAKKDLNLQSPKYYYQKVIYTSQSFEAYITAQVMLVLLNSGHNHLFENIEEYNDKVIDPINKIRELTVDIQKKLLVDFKLDKTLSEQEQQFERSVAHYTKPGVLFNLLKNEPSDFRLNVVDFMNDPTENQLLSNWLGIKSDTNNDIKSFLASFSFNHNSLNQFRLYGNENNIVGSSVSIVFNQQFFGNDVDRSINDDSINFKNQNLTSKLTANTDMLNKAKNDTKIVKDNDTTPLHPLSLFRCVYFDPETNYISIAKRNLYSFYLEHQSCDPEVINSKWQKYLDLLDEENKISDIRKLLKEIRKQIKKLKNNKRIQVISNLDQLISLALMPISCLIKHAAFEDEDECRIIYITHIADEKIQAPHDYASANSLFINYAKIEEYIDKIYLGPQCQPSHKLWINNHVRKSNNNSIKVIQSEMPLR